MASQVKFGRCEIGLLRRPQRSILSYPSTWVVRIQKVLYITVKINRSSNTYKPHSLVALPMVLHPPEIEVILLLKNTIRRPLRVEAVAREVLGGDRQ
jgi:hypothetical protein